MKTRFTLTRLSILLGILMLGLLLSGAMASRTQAAPLGILGALQVRGSGTGNMTMTDEKITATFIDFCALQSSIPEAECDALHALYSSTGGPGWTVSTGWPFTPDPCTWYGVTCTTGHVTTLNLGDNNLIGSIPAELGVLTSLRYLYLYENQLSGSIPASLGGLTSLIFFDAPYNSLSGSIPASLGGLTNLDVLSLSFNQLSGSIPAALGSLTSLTSLMLNNNQLTGSIPPELGGLTNLRFLWLYGNQLSGSIPPELGGMTSLEYLYLNGNQLTGSIPPALGDLTSLKWLWLYSNQLSGNIPSELGGLTSLTRLLLGNNPLLHGPLPLSLSSLPLERFYYNNTGLCEPDDPAFMAWLTAIPSRLSTDVTCVCNTLTLSHTGSGTDPVASPTNSVGCSAGQYFPSEPISLSGAVPDPSWFISGWTGTDNDASTVATNTLTMPTSAHTASVNYDICYSLTLSHTGNGTDPAPSPTNSTGCVTGEYVSGEVIDLTAAPDPGWFVSGWSGTDNDVSTSTNNSLTMPAMAHAASVNYIFPPGVGTYDDRYPGINYSGSWQQANYSGPYVGTLTESNTVGNSGSFIFNGEGITLVYTGYTNRGTMDIYIDAGYVTTLDQYSSSLNWQQEWTSGALGAGIHTIYFEHVGGTTVDIDAFIVTGPPPCYALTVSATGSGATPTASPPNSTGCSAGEYHPGESISLSGAAADPGWAISSWTGTDNDASTAAANTVTMPDSPLTATVNYVQPPGLGTYDDRYPGISYSGSWSQINMGGPYAGTLTNSTTVGNSGSFTFDGEGVKLVYAAYSSGTIEVSIDGGPVDIIDTSSGIPLWQQEWSSGPLAAGVHTIAFTHASGVNVYVDAFIVTGLPPPPPPPPCHILTLTHTGAGTTPTSSPTNSTGCAAGEYHPSEVIILSGAAPNHEWVISSWTGTDNDASTAATNTVTMPNSAHTAWVNYVQPPGVGIYDDRYAGINYSGSWVQINMGGPYLNTLTNSKTVGNSGSFTFDGEGITLVYTAYSSGTIEVSIDGGPVEIIDSSSSRPLWQQEWPSGPLAAGVHTIVFTHASGANVYVDAFIVTGPPPPPPCYTLTLTHIGSGVTPTALPTNSTGCPAGEYHPSETINLSGALPDPGWDISGWTGTDNDASTAATNIVTMPDSVHTAGVNYVQPPTAGTYDDRFAGINFSGTWQQITLNGPYAGTLTYSSTIGNSGSFTFDGEGITLVYAAYSSGTIEVSIDGVPVDTIDMYSLRPLWQQEWYSGVLAPGWHTITFTHTLGATVYIDAFIVH